MWFPDKLVDLASFCEYFLYLQYTHTLTIITISNKPDPIPPPTACNHDWFPFDSGILFKLGNLDFRSFMGISGTGLSFFKLTSWWLDRFCKPNDFQMQKFTGMNLGACRFAVWKATSIPLEYCLKYDGNFMLHIKILSRLTHKEEDLVSFWGHFLKLHILHCTLDSVPPPKI